ncbi:MAG: response regulator [Saprospiraceae bacterium]|nr:response regulator [Saprospiraceae bacterium]
MFSRNYKVLIIDDDPEFHQQIRFAFRRNFEFEGALDVEQMDEKLKSGAIFDMILLDLILDKNSDVKVGFDLIPRLKKAHPYTPVVVVTNDPHVYNGLEAIKRGASDFCIKANMTRTIGQAPSPKY